MLNLLGEHHCKVDLKGRMMFPARFRKQLENLIHHGLVINRDIFSRCLVLYPKPEWDKVNEEMSRLSRYNQKHQLFQRKFMKGATLVELDTAGRLLIPSILLEYAEVDLKRNNELILTGLGEKMDVWSSANYRKEILDEDFDFGALAEEVRKDIDQKTTG
ncbi:MAG: division/cell wall cluster transcriptional repressor MraZ [Crocinitomicaceae bacterium]|nr:division/cell wall cluster transcriptional repressor MraZ [Crocinitomicaceae bacterium]